MASVYITADFNTPVELNKEKVKKMKSIKEKYGEIPFVIEDNKIFLFSESCFEISTQDRSAENSFVFRFFEDVSGGTLSTYRSSSREYEEENRKDRAKDKNAQERNKYRSSADIISKNLLKELYELFEEIQIDVSMSYSDSGGITDSHIDVNVTSKGEFLYYREENWDCKNCDEENSEDRTNCWSCETEREFD